MLTVGSTISSYRAGIILPANVRGVEQIADRRLVEAGKDARRDRSLPPRRRSAPSCRAWHRNPKCRCSDCRRFGSAPLPACSGWETSEPGAAQSSRRQAHIAPRARGKSSFRTPERTRRQSPAPALESRSAVEYPIVREAVHLAVGPTRAKSDGWVWLGSAGYSNGTGFKRRLSVDGRRLRGVRRRDRVRRSRESTMQKDCRTCGSPAPSR